MFNIYCCFGGGWQAGVPMHTPKMMVITMTSKMTMMMMAIAIFSFRFFFCRNEKQKETQTHSHIQSPLEENGLSTTDTVIAYVSCIMCI